MRRFGWPAKLTCFQNNGIDAEVLYLESALVRTALIAGDIAMGGMSGTTMAAPRLQGADPIIIASFLNSLQYRLVVRPDIKTPAQLKGKRVGVASFGLGAHRGAQIMLAKLGLNPDTDVIMLQICGDPTRLSALLSGSIDASVFNPPLYKRAVEAGMRAGEKGSGVFLLSLWTTARMHCRFESQLLGDVDHPVFATERPASLRARS